MLSLVLLAALALAPPAAITIPPQPALDEQIARADGELFALFFEGKCDLPRFRAMLAEDIEFYHDKGGFNVKSAEDFVAIFAKNCRDRENPAAWRSRRELVRSSLHVDPVPGHGAMEAGEHLFYERKGDGPEKLVGRARFAMVWRLDPDGWKLSRVLSYDHGPAGD